MKLEGKLLLPHYQSFGFCRQKKVTDQLTNINSAEDLESCS